MSDKTNIKQLEHSTYHLLKRTAHLAANLYMEKVGRGGLTQRQFAVLLALSHNDGACQSTLVGLTGIDRSTLADLTSRMIAQGYIRRRRHKDDARRNVLHLTAAGNRALSLAKPGVASVDRKLSSLVPVDHRKSFRKALAILSAYADELDAKHNNNGK